MQNLLGQIRRNLRKPLIFGLCGAGGCLVAAIALGEVFLTVTERPPIVEQNPQSVVMLIDTSGSMNDDNKLQEAKNAAKAFIERQDRSFNRFAVVGFGSQVQIGTGLTSDLATLNQAIDNLSDGGGTRMDLGLATAIEQLESATSDRHILLFTDGQPAPAPSPEQIDIMIVLDVTSSMNEEIAGVQQGIQNFAQELKKRKLDAQIGLIAFGDRLFGEEPQILNFDGSVFTPDSDRFSEQVGSIQQVNGNDPPESSLDALALAARQPFRSHATKVMLLITDAPPLIPDREIPSLEAATNVLKENQIAQLHLVIQPDDRATFEQLQLPAPGETFLIGETAAGRQGFESVLPTIGKAIAETTLKEEDRQPIVEATLNIGQTALSQKINIIAVGTGDADQNFLTQLTGEDKKVFYANSGEFDQAFQSAAKLIYDSQLIGEQKQNQGILYTLLSQSLPKNQLQTPQFRFIYDALRTGGWTAILSVGASLALIVGQNLYQRRRRLLSLGETSIGTVGGIVAGLVAGSSGLLVSRFLIQSIPTLAPGGPLLGWTILGTMLGGGMARFVPNLKIGRAVLGGFLGGAMGGMGFVLQAGASNEIAGRLAGSAILGFCIGMMIALLELLTRQAKLIVHWSPTEQREFLLGSRPIILGSSSEANIYLPKKQGYAPITAQVFQKGEIIIMQYNSSYGQAKGMKKLEHQLKDGDRRKFGQITLEVKTSPEPSNRIISTH
jgi:Ca-activated chloride channel family protein